MAGENLELLHRTVLGNDRVQTDRSRDARLTRERRIDRLNTIDKRSSRDSAALLNTSLRWLRWRRRTTRSANHAAENAAHAAASDTTRNAALHAHGTGIRLGFFFNDFDVLGDDFGGD